MTETPANQRKAAERDRKRALGLRRFETWVHPADLARVRRFVERINKRRGANGPTQLHP